MNQTAIITPDTLREIFRKERTIVLIGQSACGKETQSKILQKHIMDHKPDDFQFLYLESGGLFRRNIPEYTQYMSQKLKDINDAGRLQSPGFAITQWTDEILRKWNGLGHILIDGAPRTEDEARAMFGVYTESLGRDMTVFHIKVPDEVADARMVKRNEEIIASGGTPRADSATPEARNKKLAFYHKHVRDAIYMLDEDFEVDVHDIDGERSVEEISNEILSLLL